MRVRAVQICSVLLFLFWVVPGFGQNIRSNAGTSLPASCTSGDEFTKTNATIGGKRYVCVSGSWEQQTAMLTGEQAPEFVATGAGTEGSPFTHADNTAGIQTVIDSLAGSRGGLVNLGVARYNVATPIVISTPSISLIGRAAGYNTDPNGESEGVNGTKLSITSDGIRIGNASSRVGNAFLRNLYLYGPGKTGGAKGISITNDIDQPHIENIMGTNLQYGLYVNAVLDAAHISGCGFLNNGYGAYFTTAAYQSYTKISSCEISDNDNGGIFTSVPASSDAKYLRVVNSTLVRNGRVLTTNGANLYLGNNEDIIGLNVIRGAGHDYVGNTDVAAHGLILKGTRHLIIGNNITDNTNGSGIKILSGSNSNFVIGNILTGNSANVTVDSGATSNVIIQPDVTIADSGTNTVFWDATGMKVGFGGSGTNHVSYRASGGASASYTGFTVFSNGTEKWFMGRDGTDSTDDWILRASATSNPIRVYNDSSAVDIKTTSLNTIYSSSSATRGSNQSNYNTGVGGAITYSQHARGTAASPTTLANGDEIGVFAFKGYDGGAFRQTAAITALVNGSVSSANVPTDLVFLTGVTDFGTERLRITSGGAIQAISATQTTERGWVHTNYLANTAGGLSFFQHARGTQGSPAALVSGDELGAFIFRGHDGTAFRQTAAITALVNGSVSTNNVPTDLIFYTGVTDFGTERIRISSGGAVAIADLKTTGAATGKKVVCVDTATGQLYASSTGTDCSN